MFTETPTPTIVLMPRFRSTASRSVPCMGPTPWVRVRTRSLGTGPSSGNTEAPGVPGVRSTAKDLPAANSRALVFDPRPSARRLDEAVDDRDIGGASSVKQFSDVGDRLAARLFGYGR